MSDHVKVRYLRHAPPFMPGDHSVMPHAKAKELEAKGRVKIVEDAKAPKIETGRAEFDPASSPIEDVRGYIAGHGGEIPAKAPDARLRELAASILADART